MNSELPPSQWESKLAGGASAVIAARYRLVELIGSGGMGSVWRAEDRILERAVAVKLLRAELAADETSRRRFRAEARAAASISHPNVVQVLDFGEQPTPDGERLCFLVMELVPGRAVADELVAHGRLRSGAVTAIVEQTALGLSAAHARGVVHRDIKPANLLLDANGRVKITDFGIARWAEATPLTRTGTVLGTAQYLSPEQAEGQGATPKSDLYSLGVVAFACLNGEPPFVRESAMATLLAHVRDPVPSLPPGTQLGLRALVTDLLAKSPGDRPTAEEVAARCRAFLLDDGNPEESWRMVGPETRPLLRDTDVQDGPTNDRLDIHSSRAWINPRLVRPGRRRPVLLIGSVMTVMGLVALLIAVTAPAKASRVPNVVGEPLASARSTLSHAGFAFTVHSVDAPKHADGEVLMETPKGGTPLGRGRVVRLTVSSGMVDVTPSAFIGRPFSTVAAQLTARGLHIIKSFIAGVAKPGSVVSVSPSGEVAVGSTVTVGVQASLPTTTPPAAMPSTSNPPTTTSPEANSPTTSLPASSVPLSGPTPAAPPAHGHAVHSGPKPHGKGKGNNR